jgi:tetratricopeptide (TPR) repeat protein
MYDIEELEKRWLRYRRKRLLRYSSIVLALLAVAGLAVAVLTKGVEKGGESIASNAKSVVSKKTAEPNDTQRVSKSLETQVPSMNERANAIEKRRADVSGVSGDIVVYRKGDSRKERIQEAKKLDLKIVDPGNRKVVKEIEERFRLSKNYDDAIYLAEYYYSKRDYKKAIEWAKQANTIDSLPEESWLIFCKAKAKVGHRAEALKVLDVYYKRTGSTAALNLMDVIRKNLKF